MDKIILTDCDDVVLDWFPQFRLFCEKTLNVSLSERPTQYSMQKWLNLSVEEIRALIDEFDRNQESFGNLGPICQAEIYLPKFVDDGYKIYGITASSTNPPSMQRRRKNLKRVIGDVFTDVYFVDRADEKKKYLQQFAPTFYVEDKIYNAQMAADLGHTGIVMRQLSNKDHEHEYPDLIWVDSWADIYEMISK